MSIRSETRAQTVEVRVQVVHCDGKGCTKTFAIENRSYADPTPPNWISVSHAAGPDGRRRQDFCSHECLSKGLKV